MYVDVVHDIFLDEIDSFDDSISPMRWKRFALKKTITKYVFREMLGPWLLGLLIFTFVLLMDKVLELIELVETHKVPILKSLGLFLNLQKRNPSKTLPRWIVKSLRLHRQHKDL